MLCFFRFIIIIIMIIQPPFFALWICQKNSQQPVALNSPWPASTQFRFSLVSWSYKRLGALPAVVSQESNGWGIWIPSLWFSAYLESSTSSCKERTEAKNDLLSTFLWAWFSPKAQPYCDGDRKHSLPQMWPGRRNKTGTFSCCTIWRITSISNCTEAYSTIWTKGHCRHWHIIVLYGL